MGALANVPQNESSRERKFPRSFIPRSESSGNELARKRKGQGAKGPRSELARERIGQGPIGRFAPGSEKARLRLI